MGGVNEKPKQASIIIGGLDNSGKSLMINKLSSHYVAELEIGATVGYKLESFTKNKIKFDVIDMSGQGKYRSLWEKYYEQAEAIIFVVDASD